MKTKLTFDKKHQCAILKWDGSFSSRDQISIGARLGAFCRENSIKKILIDSRNNNVTNDTGELLEYGESFVDSCLKKCRVALLREHQNSGMELVATIAMNRGVVMKDFTDEKTAIDWLNH